MLAVKMSAVDGADQGAAESSVGTLLLTAALEPDGTIVVPTAAAERSSSATSAAAASAAAFATPTPAAALLAPTATAAAASRAHGERARPP
jgi:hypothetical protein